MGKKEGFKLALSLNGYVKFIKGTPNAYQNLAVKNNETLYFIVDPESPSKGKLYLGTTLISGGSDLELGDSLTLSDVQDILISEELDHESLLVYDAETEKWVNKPIADVLESSGVIAQTQVFEAIVGEGEDHPAAIARVVGEKEVNNGDIAIVKDLIASGKYQHTAYIYNGEAAAWTAMDGNYSAENVYFKEDLLTTSAVGEIKLTNGQATIPASGKNLKEVFNTIFVKEAIPDNNTQPSVSVTLNKAGNYEVGTTVTGISWSATLNAGKYEYGPATGIVATEWTAEDSASKDFTTNSGTCADWLVEDNKPFSVTATAEYEDGAVPVTNTGNPYEAAQFKAGSKTGTSSKITGYRAYFYGPDASGATIDTDFIRTKLTKSTEALASKTISWKAADTEGIKRYIVAIPESANKAVTSAIITSSMNANALEDYKLQTATVDVEGADDYTAVPYKVWIYEPASIANVEEHTITLG